MAEPLTTSANDDDSKIPVVEPIGNFQSNPYAAHEAFRKRFPDRECSAVPGLFFFDSESIFGQPNDLDHLAKACEALGGSKKGYISGTSGPKVSAYGRNNLPPVVVRLIDQVRSRLGLFVPKHSGLPTQVSVNVYKPANLAMVPHKDGPGSFGIILSLGSPALLQYFFKPLLANERLSRTQVYTKAPPPAEEAESAPKKASGTRVDALLASSMVSTEPMFSVLMQPGSVLVQTGPAYVDWVHCVDGVDVDRVPETGVVNATLMPAEELKRLGGLPGGQVLRDGVRVSVVMWER